MKRFLLSIVLVLLMVSVGWAKYWYAAPSGTNGNGSESSPWVGFSNIVWGSGGVDDGDTLWLMPGIYREQLTVGLGGQIHITVRGDYNNEVASISGGDEITEWTGPDANGEYTASLSNDPFVVMVDDMPYKRGSAGSLANDEWDWVSGTLYIGFSPSGHTIEAGVRSKGIDCNNNSYIDIKNLRIYCVAKAPVSTDGGGVYVPAASYGINIINSTFRGCRLAVMNKGGCDINGCNAQYCADGFKSLSTSSDITIQRCNIVGTNWNGSTQIWDSVDGESISITNCTSPNIKVSQNVIYDSWFGIKLYTNTSTGSVEIMHNIVKSCQAGGIAVNGTTGGSYTDVKMTYNLIHDLAGSSRAYQLSSGDPATVTGTVRVINNTSVDNPWAYHLGWGNVTFKNNLALNISDGGYFVYAKTANSLSTSNNLYYDSDGGTEWWRAPGQAGTTDYATWQTQTSETAALTQDPLLTSAYHLTYNSPCIDAGTKVTGIHDQDDWKDLDGHVIHYGSNPDIGYYEYNTNFIKRWGRARWNIGKWGRSKWGGARW